MKRMAKIIIDYEKTLINKSVKNTHEIIKQVIQSDITKGKYTRFLLDCFINDNFRLEDLQGGLESTIGQAISLFHKHKAKLPEEMRSITKYTSPGDLWNAVKEYEQVLTGKEEKKFDKEKVYAETEFVYHDIESGFQIISPLTKNSAQWWGRGTRWCTSAEKNNMFEYYVTQAPLFVILMPDGHKLQLWKNGNNIQFMDEADNDIELDYIEDNWHLLEPICLWLKSFIYFPIKYITPEICKITIEQNGEYLGLMNEEYITSELCEIAVKQDGWTLMDVPIKYITPELCKIAVEQDGWALNYVPEKYKTLELYELAINKSGHVIQFIPIKYITPELCRLAVEQNGLALEFIPEAYKTPELYHLALQNTVFALNFVPEEYRTPGLYKLAVEQDGYFLQHIPQKYITYALCLLAVQQNSYALQYVPEELRTMEIYEIAIRLDTNSIQFISKDKITPEILEIKKEEDIKVLNIQFCIPDYTKVYKEVYFLYKN